MKIAYAIFSIGIILYAVSGIDDFISLSCIPGIILLIPNLWKRLQEIRP